MESKEAFIVVLAAIALCSLDFIGFLPITFIVVLSSFSGGIVLFQYLAPIIGGLILGFINSFTFRRVTKDDGVNILGAVLTPLLAVLVNLAFLTVFHNTSSTIDVDKLSSSAQGAMVRLNPMIHADVFLSLFLLSFNLPFLYLFFRKKERDSRALLWYALVPVLYFFIIPYVISSSFSAMLLG